MNLQKINHLFLSESNFYNGKIKHASERGTRLQNLSLSLVAMLAKRQLLTSTSITRILTFSRIILQHT